MLINHRNSGFTLIEITMVMLIIVLLMTGLLPTITSQIDMQRSTETRKNMSDINEALMGYAIVNGRLPCPAQASLATGTTNAGLEALTTSAPITCACQAASGSNDTVAHASNNIACAETSITGVIPWVTLGIKETDAWERRYTYRVTSRFADQIAANTTNCSPALTTPPVASSFALCSPGVPDVISAATGGTAVASNVPAIFLSHGKNGLGAYLRDGSQLPVGADNDELENSDNDNNFVSHTTTTSFDDMPAWIAPTILSNRMVAAGKLP